MRYSTIIIRMIVYTVLFSFFSVGTAISIPLKCQAKKNAFPLGEGDVFNQKTDAEEVLGWRYTYGKEPSVLSFIIDNSFQNLEVLSFQIKSSRTGELFLRIDQSDGNIFLSHFPVNTSYSYVYLTPEDFVLHEKKTGQKMNPKLVKNVFLVDLNGQDGTTTGERSVFLKEVAYTPKTIARESGAGQIAIVAFDKNGHVMNLMDFKNNGLSANRWFGVWENAGTPVTTSVSEELLDINGASQKVPVIYPQSAAERMEIFYWPCGSRYKVRLKVKSIESKTSTISGTTVLFLNQALAKTRLEDLTEWIAKNAQGFGYEKEIAQLKAELASAEANPVVDQKRAADADAVLEKLLNLSHKAVMTVSKNIITNKINPEKRVTLPQVSRKKMGGASDAVIELVDPLFRIGIGHSFGFTPETPASTVKSYYQELKKAGFNHFVLPLFWDQIADQNNTYSPSAWGKIFALDALKEIGFTFQMHGIIQSGMPASVKNMKGQAFELAAIDHLKRTFTDFLERYGERIVLSEAINEASSVEFGGLPVNERVVLTSELIKFIRYAFPGRDVMVNEYDWDRGEIYGNPSNPRITGTKAFCEKLAHSAHPPDVVGLEWYPGLRVDQPRFNADLSEPCFDILDTSLFLDELIAINKKIIISESNVPGTMLENDRNGFAWGRWSLEAQAEAASDMLHLALSKTGVIGWTWWSITDSEPWNREGGLFSSDGKIKPVLQSVSGTIERLKAGSKISVERDNTIRVPTLPGLYRITSAGLEIAKFRVDEKSAITFID